jgi:hypothetical protein
VFAACQQRRALYGGLYEWRFTPAAARTILTRLYPSFQA